MKKQVYSPLLMAMGVLFAAATVFAATGATLTQSVTYGGETITLQLTKENLRGPNFELWVQNSLGGYDAVTPVEERSYIGTVDEYPGAVSCGVLLDNGQFKGAVYFDRGVTWFTLDDEVTGTRALDYSTFAAFQYPTAPTVGAGQAGTNTYRFDVGVDVSFDYYNQKGGGSVAAAFELIEHSVNNVRAIYMRDVLLQLYLGRVIIRADEAQDPYAASMTLGGIKTEWNTNHTDADRDVVCGVDPAFGGGLAWVSAIGTSNAYSANNGGGSGAFNVVWRHELGHNWGCGHFVGGKPEGKGIMGGNSPARFSGCEAYRIFNYRNTKLGILGNQGTYTAVDFAPYASLDTANAMQGSSVTVDIMANDYDANADSLSLQSYDSSSNLGIAITISVGTGPGGRDELIYGAATALGTDHFLYTVVDSSGQTATGVVLIDTTVPFTDYQAEDAVYSGAVFADDRGGYTATGYVDYKNSSTDYIEWTVNVPADSIYTLNWCYALLSGDRPLEVKIDGLVVDPNMSFPATGSWTTWDLTADLIVNLTAGAHTVRTTAIGSSGANIDLLRASDGINASDIDAYVRAGSNADTNYGSAETLDVKNVGPTDSYTRECYLRFNCVNLTGQIETAVLKLTPTHIQSPTGTIRIRLLADADDMWDEDAITWNTRLSGTGLEVTFPASALQLGVEYSIDVTSLVIQASNANKLATFHLDMDSAIHVQFHSQESADRAFRPSLDIVTSTTPPAAPAGLVAIAGEATVSLDWSGNTESDLDSYNVYRSTTLGSGYSQIETDVAISNYVDNTAAGCVTYFYVVTAVDFSDNESGYSNEEASTPTGSIVWGDVNSDCHVNLGDVLQLSMHWLTDEPSSDIAPLPLVDGIVNQLDFAVVAEQWQEY